MRTISRFFVIAAVLIVALFLTGCPRPASIVGSWEMSVWSGDCEGEPDNVLTIRFEEGGGGSTSTAAAVAWTQDGGQFEFTVTPTRGLPATAEGEVVDDNHLAGEITGALSSGCWQAVRLAELP